MRWALVLLGLVALVLLVRAAPGILWIGLGGVTLALILSFPVRGLARFMPRALAILPFIGSWLGAIPAITIAAFFDETKALLTPHTQGQALRVHPILVFLAVIAGTEIAGLPGAIFAVPALAVLRVLFDFLRHRLRVLRPVEGVGG